eukprot:Gb_11244 [translate_table: standard]
MFISNMLPFWACELSLDYRILPMQLLNLLSTLQRLQTFGSTFHIVGVT